MTKIENGYSVVPHAHVPIGTRHLEGPILRLDLAGELAELRSSEAFKTHGHSAKTLAKYADLRLVLLAFRAGEVLSEHSTKGRVSLQVLDGRVAFKFGHETTELAANGLLTIAPSIAHDLVALEDCGILLTMTWSA